jgi:nicotinamidase-related amidase
VSKALLLVDVLTDFEHEDGGRLLASFRDRHARLSEELAAARNAGVAVVYANDGGAEWDPANLISRVLRGKAGELMRAVVPEPGEPIFLKPDHSAFSHTPVAHALRDMGVNEIALAGTATEMCVFRTAADGVRHGFEVVVLAGACASIDPRYERLALDYLQDVLRVRVQPVDWAATSCTPRRRLWIAPGGKSLLTPAATSRVRT